MRKKLEKQKQYLENRELLLSSMGDESPCSYCNVLMTKDLTFMLRTGMSVDHIQPKSSKINHDPANLLVCCKLCNTKKASKRGVLLYKLKTPAKLTEMEIDDLTLYVDFKARLKVLNFIKEIPSDVDFEQALLELFNKKRAIFKIALYNAILKHPNRQKYLREQNIQITQQTKKLEEKIKHLDFYLYYLFIKKGQLIKVDFN